MKILVRLPNWLGDMVMSVGALHQVRHFWPEAKLSVIVKKGLHDLLPHFPPTVHQFIFSKEEYEGLRGVWRFGRMIRQHQKFDLYISFPDSFSAALMGLATGARERIGFKKEGRQMLLTQSFNRPKGLHRADEYVALLQAYSGIEAAPVTITLQHPYKSTGHVVVNINSEASSRRLTPAKAKEIIEAVRNCTTQPVILIGGPKEKTFVDEVMRSLSVREGITSMAGETSLPQLVKVLATASVVLTTDSGPAHLANALGTQTVVLFGAGNEINTSPYNRNALQVIRLNKLACEPCTKNVCVRFGTPQCLELLETPRIIQAVQERIQHGS
jgi:ADP-heptose:LPS heptosyltransferase